MPKVSVVIVTYNRLNELRICVEALANQKIKDFYTIIVNNGSTDGTADYLATLGSDKIVITQENLGGAGGFYAGMKYAYEHGAEWIWLMDDDGLPDSHQLEELISASNNGKNKVLNALVVNINDHSRLAFGLKEEISALPEAPLLDNLFSAFNGTFIHRSVIDKVGFIKREMFIWGDEQEYVARIRKAGFRPLTARRAIHYHPEEKGKKDFAIPFINKCKVMVKPERLSKYYYRNLGYLNATYRPMSYHIKAYIYHTIYFLRKGNLKELGKFYKYYNRGMRNNYTD